MSVRSTYALDETTSGNIKRLAATWAVSQAEVIRRAVAQAIDSLPAPAMTPADVVAYYASHPARSSAEIARRAKEIRRARRDEDAMLDRRRLLARGQRKS